MRLEFGNPQHITLRNTEAQEVQAQQLADIYTDGENISRWAKLMNLPIKEDVWTFAESQCQRVWDICAARHDDYCLTLCPFHTDEPEDETIAELP